MKIYRLEMGGKGPYNNTFRGMSDEEYDRIEETMNELEQEHSCNDSHSGWMGAFDSKDFEEMTRGENADILSGFCLISDLHLWFMGFLDELLHIGFEIHIYDVSEESVFFSNKGLDQIAFDSSYATPLGLVPA